MPRLRILQTAVSAYILYQDAYGYSCKRLTERHREGRSPSCSVTVCVQKEGLLFCCVLFFSVPILHSRIFQHGVPAQFRPPDFLYNRQISYHLPAVRQRFLLQQFPLRRKPGHLHRPVLLSPLFPHLLHLRPGFRHPVPQIHSLRFVHCFPSAPPSFLRRP